MLINLQVFLKSQIVSLYQQIVSDSDIFLYELEDTKKSCCFSQN